MGKDFEWAKSEKGFDQKHRILELKLPPLHKRVTLGSEIFPKWCRNGDFEMVKIVERNLGGGFIRVLPYFYVLLHGYYNIV